MIDEQSVDFTSSTCHQNFIPPAAVTAKVRTVRI